MFDIIKKRPDHILIEYLNDKGEFDYEKYRSIQEAGNKEKLHFVSAQKGNIQFLAEYLIRQLRKVEFGICHGTRQGMEQAWFMEYLPGSEVMGTEISSTATEFPHTVQWDFHEENPDWIGKADFVYSNSLDHAYDPAKAFRAWMKSLKSHGLCILEHTEYHKPEYADDLDPFGVTLKKLKVLIVSWGNYEILHEAQGPAAKKRKLKPTFLFIRNAHS